MKRFLSLPSNRHIVATMKYLELNDFKQAAYLTTNDKRCFDVITFESNSYFTKLHEILIPVGPGDKALPAIPMPKRLRFKCADQNATRLDDRVIEVPEAHSQDGAGCADIEPSRKKHCMRIIGGTSSLSRPADTESASSLPHPAESTGNCEEGVSQVMADQLKEHQARETQLWCGICGKAPTRASRSSPTTPSTCKR